MARWMLSNAYRAAVLIRKNAAAPEGFHYDLSVQDYVENPVEEGKHWSNETYRMEPD